MTNDTFNFCMGAAEAAGYKVDTPIVNAVLGNLAGTLPIRKCEIGSIKCVVCNCFILQNVNLEEHVNGSRHKKNLEALNIIAQIESGKKKGIRMVNGTISKAVQCDFCSLTLNSPRQLTLHLLGIKHKKRVAKFEESKSEVPSTKRSSLVQNQSNEAKEKTMENFKCDTCHIFVNSKIVLKEHLNSKKHKLKERKYSRSRRRTEYYSKKDSDHSRRHKRK